MPPRWCSRPRSPRWSKTAKAKKPLPYLLICAFIANAASFVLPISNPANLVIYGSHMPPLLQWLPATRCPRRLDRRDLRRAAPDPGTPSAAGVSDRNRNPGSPAGGKMAAVGIARPRSCCWSHPASTSHSACRHSLAGLATDRRPAAARVAAPSNDKESPGACCRLVAGLFVLVEALEKTGVTGMIGRLFVDLLQRSRRSPPGRPASCSRSAATWSNNLPAGLIAGRVVEVAQVPDHVRGRRADRR